MTNIKFFYLLVFIAIILVGFEINSGKLRWGTAYFNDSTSSLITSNKGLQVNGTLAIPDITKIQFNGNSSGGTYISGEITDIIYNGGSHTFCTHFGNSIMSIDSTNGVILNYGKIKIGSTIIQTGTGTPEGAVTAPVGSIFLRTDNANSFYVKQTGSGNTGWVLK